MDEEGHQYVDLVQEGGGVLGMALMGFTYVLEELGFRFLSLGGTSAGAINTLLLASLQEQREAGNTLTKSEQIIEALAGVNLMDFADGGPDATRLIKAFTSRSRLSILKQIPAIIENLDEVLWEQGINPGDQFKAWMKSLIPHPVPSPCGRTFIITPLYSGRAGREKSRCRLKNVKRRWLSSAPT